MSPRKGANEPLLPLGSWPISAGGNSIQGMDGSMNREEKGCTGLLCPPRLQGEVLGVKAACQRDRAGPQDCTRHWAASGCLSIRHTCSSAAPTACLGHLGAVIQGEGTCSQCPSSGGRIGTSCRGLRPDCPPFPCQAWARPRLLGSSVGPGREACPGKK